jgi:hypothetical protein
MGQKLAMVLFEIKLKIGYHINWNRGSPKTDYEWLRVVNSFKQGVEEENMIRVEGGNERKRGVVIMNFFKTIYF